MEATEAAARDDLQAPPPQSQAHLLAAGIVAARPAGPRLDARALIFLVAIVTGGLALRIAALVAFPGLHHADETFQMLEQAHRLTFGYGVVPWEFADGLRSPLPPLFLGGLYRLSEMAFGHGPRVYITVTRLALATFSLLPVVALYFMGLRRSLAHALIIGLVGATWFEMVFFSFRTLLEPLSLDFLLIGMALVTYRSAPLPRLSMLAVGFCLGCALMLRVQFAPAILVIVGSVIRRDGRSSWIPLLGAVAVPVLIFGVADWIVWGSPFHSVLTSIRENLYEGVAAGYGVKPFGWYFTNALALCGSAAIALGVLAACTGRATRLWVLVGLAILLPHVLIAHKEYRFVYGGFVCLVIAAAATCAELCVSLRSPAPRSTALRCAVIGSIWVLTSGYLATTPMMKAMWKNNVREVRAALLLSDRNDVCGVLMDGVATPGYAFVHHDVPLYMAPPNSVAGPGESADGSAYSAFNYIVARKSAAAQFPPNYQLLTCVEGGHDAIDACLLRRPGRCTPRPSLTALRAMRDFGRVDKTTHRPVVMPYLD